MKKSQEEWLEKQKELELKRRRAGIAKNEKIYRLNLSHKGLCIACKKPKVGEYKWLCLDCAVKRKEKE